jgi:hypothetical protein
VIGRPTCFAPTGNHYRDFLLHDLSKLLEGVPLAERECGACKMVLLCELLTVTPIMADGQVEEDSV